VSAEATVQALGVRVGAKRQLGLTIFAKTTGLFGLSWLLTLWSGQGLPG